MSEKVYIACTKEEDKAVQSEKDSTDVNKIVNRFEKTGLLPMQQRQGVYMDVSNFPDFRAVRDHITMVNDYFMTLPAATRARFENDPAQLLDFMSDPANEDEARKLGLASATEVPKVHVESDGVSREDSPDSAGSS